ncbi:homeobox protein engrailed-2-like [Octopus sinensis]|uniref:Homeobox protein engrailed-2-like n=1 Tax=Octopus sinensis TaxID=2607531 RepID=A0A6P7TWY3_9MOLL|nr:homeobox protein engrailed-2-like [Octopus sinensis]
MTEYDCRGVCRVGATEEPSVGDIPAASDQDVGGDGRKVIRRRGVDAGPRIPHWDIEGVHSANKIWMAQQQAAFDKKKQENLIEQYKREQDYLENKALLGDKKAIYGISFLYEPPSGLVEKEVKNMRQEHARRKPYSRPQISLLELEFETNRYLTRERRWNISQQLRLSEKQIKIWFQNRRMKMRKMIARSKDRKD